MAKTVTATAATTCIRCKKPIGSGKKAKMERSGLSFYYYHPGCHKPGYHWHHGRYVKEPKK